jgi:hypothetical protein
LVFPDHRAAIAVFTNQMATPAAATLTSRIADFLWHGTSAAQPRTQVVPKPTEAGLRATRVGREFLEELRQGKLDRTVLSPNALDFFDATAVSDYRRQLAGLGPIQAFTLTSAGSRGGMKGRVFRVKFKAKTFAVSTFELADGKLEQYLVIPVP